MSQLIKHATTGPSGRRQLRYSQQALADVQQVDQPSEFSSALGTFGIAKAQDEPVDMTQQTEEEKRAAYERGFAEGLEEGRAQAAIDSERQYEILAAAAEDAVRKLQDHLAESAQLSRYLLAVILERLFGAGNEDSGLLERLLAHQVSQIDPHELLAVQLAASDVEDPSALRQLLDTKGLSQVALECTEGLASGTLHLRLKRGTLDASLAQQRAAIDTTLDTELGRVG